MTDALTFFKELTPGGVGIWTLVAMLLAAWWKGLPTFLDAMANRQSKIEERMGKLLDDATTRFTRELAEADKRHEECIQGQERLRVRMEAQGARMEVQDQCIREQQSTIEGLKRQMMSMQVSAIRTDGMAPSPIIEAMIEKLM